MVKIFIETSTLIRYYTQDDKRKYANCVDLFDSIQQGNIKPYLSNIVLLEMYFVLTGIYSFPKEKVLEAQELLIAMRNLTILSSSDIRQAIQLTKKHNIKYADCLIATQVPKNVTLITYDKDFSKLPHLMVKTPKGLLTQ